MKIGILTYHRTINYGTFLQCYSLVEKLKTEYADEDIEVIDYSTPHNYFFPYFMGIRMLTLGAFTEAIQYFSRIRIFRKLQKTLPLSQKVISRKPEKLFKKIKNKFDVIIVGSDTVFNCALGFPTPFFLNSKLGCYKFSYAASTYGMKQDEDINKYIKEAIKQFHFVGLRDSESERFLLQLCPDKIVHHTSEPTLHLDMNNINVNIEDFKIRISNKVNCNKPFLGIMSTNRELGKIVKRHFGNTHTIVSVAAHNPYADINLLHLTPFEWAKIFSLFDITFTNFFHGTVFSLKNLTPVIAVNRLKEDKEKIGKVEDLLIRMNLQDWYFKDISTEVGQMNMIKKAKELISNSDKYKIQEALSKEMEYFNPFKKALDEVLKESVKK